MKRAAIGALALLYLGLAAHLLFIPYAFSPLSWDEAVRRFTELPWLALGSDQNVALASRALMFVPAGGLLAAWVAPVPRRGLRVATWIAATAVGALCALAINFFQLWFPGRTASLNNIAAEWTGVALGAFLWCAFGLMVRRWWERITMGGTVSVKAMLTAYVVVYLVASLAPFDFVTSVAELQEKASSALWGWWTAPIGCGRTSCSLNYLLKALLALPCGIWFAEHRRDLRNVWPAATAVAVLVALLIETARFFMVSGVSQGVSLVARVGGMLAGVTAFSWRREFSLRHLERFGRPLVVLLAIPFLITLVYVAGWGRSAFLGVAPGLAKLRDVVWMPFYFQYFAPYQATMLSTMVHLALYAPIGVACWAWGRNRRTISVASTIAIAAPLSFAIETSKVFLDGRMPDYTDVLIAVVSASAVFVVLRFASRMQPISGTQLPAHQGGRQRASRPRRTDPSAAEAEAASAVGYRLTAVIALGLVAVSIAAFPAGRIPLALLLVGYALLLWWKPSVYLIVVPALLPVLDWAPVTGRFFWDEFDILLATTLGVRLLAMRAPAGERGRTSPVAGYLLMVSVAFSTVVGLIPLPAIDANAFSTYLSPYNALRIAKGYVWAAWFVWLIRHDHRAGAPIPSLLITGLAACFLAASATVFLEMAAFGTWSPLDAFRAGGLTSAVHVGGAYLEALLVVLAPYALMQALQQSRSLLRLVWYIVLVVGVFAAFMTLSRAAVAALTVSWLVVAVVWWRMSTSRHRGAPGGARGIVEVGAALLAVAVVAAGAMQSEYFRERLARSGSDMVLRMSHWKETWDLMTRDTSRLLAGFGLGSFPREYYLAHVATHRLPGYRLEHEGEVRYLVLTGGVGLYVDQRIFAETTKPLRFSGLVRSPQLGELRVKLCVKSLLNSLQCDDATVPADVNWKPFSVDLYVPEERPTMLAKRMPIALSIFNQSFGSRVEVTQLSLKEGEQEFLRNGSFREGFDRWFFTSDVHRAWRALNTPLQIAFEQGLLGVLACLMIMATALSSIRAASPRAAAAFAGSLAAFGVVALFDSLMDSPRLVLLLALVWMAGVVVPRAAGTQVDTFDGTEPDTARA